MNNLLTTRYTFTPTAGQCANRTTLTVTVYPVTPAPTGSSVQTVCTGATLADLVFTGSIIKWYATATGGASLATTTLLVEGSTYFASQTVNGCESPTRSAKTVSIMNSEIIANATTVCAGIPVLLSVSDNVRIPVPIQNPIYSGFIQSDYTVGATTITNMSTSYAVPGMMVYGDATQKFGSVEASMRLVLTTSPNPSAGIAMAVTPNTYNDAQLYNGPGSYFLSVANNRLSLFKGTGNVPSGYFPPVELAGSTISSLVLTTTSVYKLKMEIKPNAHIYCYLNDVLYLDYTIVGGVVPSGKFALIASNAQFQYTGISSYYTPDNYLWSTGATTATIAPTPTQTTTYWVDIITNAVTCRKFKTITVTPSVVPTFAAVAPIVLGTTLTALPTTSNNGITGTWSPALKNTATTTYTFTPTVGQCASPTTLTITVNPILIPLFNPVTPICAESKIAALPTTSINGIVGTWSPKINNMETTQYLFSPREGQGATKTTMTIEVQKTQAPIGLGTQQFQVNAAIKDLAVIGSDVVWFHSDIEALSNRNPIAINEPLESGAVYYAMQTNNGCRSTSALAVSIATVLGVNPFEVSELKYYPNPVIDVLTFTNTTEITSIEVYDMIGQLIEVIHPNSKTTQLDMSRLAAAMYLISVESEGKTEMVKIIKR
jgi:hypothetical protein